MSTARHLAPAWKPGQSGNPGGRPALPPELRAIKALSVDEVSRIVSKYARMTRESLQEAVTRSDIPMLELTVASIFTQSAKNGDYQRLAFLLDRVIGKPKEVILEPDKFEQMSNDELVGYIKEHMPQLTAKEPETK